ncbi:TRAP transporter substrate-binding protein [bacterium]|nr:TRAP transporter substrate-binding protein [bacterium]
MSSSPGEADWLDDALPLPKAGLIWPWIVVGSLLFVLGLYLLLPGIQDRPSRSTPSPATPMDSPTQLAPQVSDQRALNLLFVDSAASSFDQAAESIHRQLSAATRGRVGLTIHPSGLFQGKKLDEMSIIEQVRKGQAQMGLVTCSPLTNFSPAFEVFDLPFLFQTFEQADRVLEGPIGDKLLKSLETQDLVGLGTMEVGFRVFSSSVPLPTLADFRGKRVRVMQSSTAIQMARQLGCEAVPAPVDKIYQMGKEGYIDAADRTYPTYWDFKLYEVQRYITESRHSYTMKVLIMNKEAYQGLDEETRQSLRKIVKTVEVEQRKQQRLDDQRVKQECRKQGIQIYELGPGETAHFVEACQPLYDEYQKLRGSELVDAIRAFTKP